MWLESPGGGEPRSSKEIISEVNCWLCFCKPSQSIEELKEWLQPLAKKKKLLRMQNAWRDELYGFRLTMEDVDTALSMDNIIRFLGVMEKVMAKKKLSGAEHRNVIDTLVVTATITQQSAIRPGAFQNMTLLELGNSMQYIILPSDGSIYNFVFVVNHKTFAMHGPIAILFEESLLLHIHYYIKYV